MPREYIDPDDWEGPEVDDLEPDPDAAYDRWRDHQIEKEDW